MRTTWKTTITALGLGAIAISGAGCGDDKQPSAEDVSAYSPPHAAIIGEPTVFEGETVELNASVSYDDDGEITTYQWEQDPDDSLTVQLSGADRSLATFTAPEVDATTRLHFTLTVTDDHGLSDSLPLIVTIIDS